MIDPDDYPSVAELERDEHPNDPPDRVTLLVCQCGVIAKGYAAARCGRDARHNVRHTCPVLWWTYELVEGDQP
jgi:hypothetical protein